MITPQQALAVLSLIGFVALFALVLAEPLFRPDDDDELSHWFQD